MKKKKQIISIILFILAAIIAILGIVQLALYIPSQLTMVKEAAEQGATTEIISEYYLQQFIPQIITYVIAAFGVAALLFAAGVIYQKLSLVLNSPFNFGDKIKVTEPEVITKAKEETEEISDDFFEDFETTEPEKE